MDKQPVRMMDDNNRLTLNLAIIGGGRTCGFYLDLFRKNPFPYLAFNILAICDVNPQAEGMCLARELGIPTYNNYLDILTIEDLDGVIELTTSRDVLLDLIRSRPKGLFILEHNAGRLLRTLFEINEKLRLAQQQVALERAVSELLLQQTHESIVLLNPDFRIMDANQGYLNAVNRTRDEAIGRHCYEIIYGFKSPCSEWQPELECPMLETLQTGEKAHVIHEQANEKGQLTFCNLDTYPVTDEDGRVVRVIEIRRDITQELPSRWEMRLKELKTDLGKLVQEDRMLTLGRLSASCAHEINNPIQGLLTFGHLMQSILEENPPKTKDLAQFRDYLGLMCSELERCGNIVSGLLSFARESAMETRELDLNDVIRSVITLTRHHMELQGIELELDLPKEPLMIMGDVNQLQQCFLNLIFNAIDATSEGRPLRVWSQSDAHRGIARVTIQDFGCGIPEEDQDKIFDPFFTTKSDSQGTGLGLSITYGIVKGHDGQIHVESNEGEGTVFTVEFPLLNLIGQREQAHE
jgi:signal transduction histidine kinase